MMTYQETIDYLYNLLPVFHRVGAKAFKADLSNTLKLCEYLGNPQKKFKSIHIAGTNGKGSTSHFMASILQSAGYKTGLYTSPHLKDFTERFRINGQSIDKANIIAFIEEHKNFIEELKPSFFELSVAIAFDYFAKEKVDVAVIEVGLGGRLDSTNVINPLLSIITNIGFDHTDILGDTLPKIAFEKAGIIKPHTPVVISEYHSETSEVFKDVATKQEAEIYFAEDFYKIEEIEKDSLALKFKVFDSERNIVFSNLTSELIGKYQKKNLLGVLKAVDILIELGFNIDLEAFKVGIANVSKLTGLKGRFQILGTKPLIVCDTGHNSHGIFEVLNHLENLKFDRKIFILGFVKDKDIQGILNLFPKNATFIFCQANSPRSESPENLIKIARSIDIQGYSILNVNDAIQKAKEIANEKDLIFIGGSTFVVSEINGL